MKMEKVIRTFKHEQFGEIRTMVDEKGEPWFVGKKPPSRFATLARGNLVFFIIYWIKTIRNLENITIFVPESKVFITLIYQTRNYEHHRNQRH